MTFYAAAPLREVTPSCAREQIVLNEIFSQVDSDSTRLVFTGFVAKPFALIQQVAAVVSHTQKKIRDKIL